ncbi:MAG TPA: hypothetical protein VMV17_21925 [Streptosporangiaceae bacterium]|nr:hypothetical protein [Streptosporangiaceae bacterium]
MSDIFTAPGQPSGERDLGSPARPDQANPGVLVTASVDECLGLARTWHAWDGRPMAGDMDGHPNTWTPHKALRRIADHLLDHLHQVEALLAGAEPLPDEWHGRRVTLDADWARFTEPDYDEACSRLRRLARWYVLRYATAGVAAWDEPRDGAWTLREIAEHVAGVRYYAEQVGSLS